MHTVRVIGRIDLAQKVHEALVAAGVNARLTTAAPASVVATTGQDDSEIDVVAGDMGICLAIKKAAPRRPVVAMITRQAEAGTALIAKTGRGPDAYAFWPPNGEDIKIACDHARETVGSRRPRIVWRLRLLQAAFLSPSAMLVAAAGARIWGAARRDSHAGRFVMPFFLAFLFLHMMLFAAVRWKFASASKHPRWARGYSIFEAAVAVYAAWLAISFLRHHSP